MNKTKVKIPAKINLSLDVVGVSNGYHDLMTLVSSVSLYNVITVKKRKDNAVTVIEKGIPSNCPTEKLNAFKGAKLFQEKYNTCGVDIVIKRNIPVGGGLGCSSADAAGVLKGMQKLFGVKDDTVGLANLLGSDTAYMLNGGYAVLTGRGDKIEKVESKLKFYGIILSGKDSVNTKDCFNKFDELNKTGVPSTDKCKKALEKGDIISLGKNLKNDLYAPALTLLPETEQRLNALTGEIGKCMTGSGSAVFAIYETKKQMRKAFDSICDEYKKSAIKVKSV